MQEHATPAKEPTYERGRRNAALFFFEVIMNIEFTDNSKEVLDLMQPVDTGNLQNSITHMVDDGEMAAYVGSNSEYAIYQELGTGEHYPGGRPTPWVYQDAKGNWHWTKGNPAKPFIKPAVADHAQTYRNIIEDELKNG